jgi:hypothetical protein
MTATSQVYDDQLQQVQARLDAGHHTETTVKRREKILKDTEEFKRTVEDTRRFDRDLGPLLASSGYRTRPTATCDVSSMDWALIRIPER